MLIPWLPIYPCVHAIRCPFLYICHSEKTLNLFATNRCNKMCVCVRLLEWLHWWHTFYVTCYRSAMWYLSSPGHRRNTPSARVPLLTAPSAGSIYLFAQFPTPARVLLSRGLSGGSSKPPTHCSQQAFEATFDKLQLIRTTLISKMIKFL